MGITSFIVLLYTVVQSGEQLLVVRFMHGFSDEVIEIGEGVTSHKVGDRVVVEPIYSCGKCEACKHGHYNVCEQLVFHGLGGEGGGYQAAPVVEKK